MSDGALSRFRATATANIPVADFCRLGNVSDGAWVIYSILLLYVDWQSGECFPSLVTLAEISHKHKTSVIRALRELQKKGRVEITKRKSDFGDRDNNLYRLPGVVAAARLRGSDGATTGSSAGATTGSSAGATTGSSVSASGGSRANATQTKPYKNETNRTTSCDESAKRTSSRPSIDPSQVKYPTFPCAAGKKSAAPIWELDAQFLVELAEGFPAVDIQSEAKKSHAWILSNLSKRKTAAGMRKFLFGWMERAQNRGSRAAPLERATVPFQPPKPIEARVASC